MSLDKGDLHEIKKIIDGAIEKSESKMSDRIDVASERTEERLAYKIEYAIEESESRMKDFVEKTVTEVVKKTEDKIMTRLDREVSDLVEINQINIGTADQVKDHGQRITRIEKKLSLPA